MESPMKVNVRDRVIDPSQIGNIAKSVKLCGLFGIQMRIQIPDGDD